MAVAAERTLILIGELPIFRGRPLPHEIKTFKQGVDVRTFLRSLDNYYRQNRIEEDADKLRVLYSRIDKQSGDAQRLMNMYIDEDLTYNQVEIGFLDSYPSPNLSEIQATAKKIKSSRINEGLSLIHI